MTPPTYKDGSVVLIGDRVRGVGLNQRLMGYPASGIEGIVVELNADPDLPLTVAYLDAWDDHRQDGIRVDMGQGRRVMIQLEYGDTTGFDKVC
jgi:hypothetical protein